MPGHRHALQAGSPDANGQAPERDGAIARIHVEPGASLAVDQPMLEFA